MKHLAIGPGAMGFYLYLGSLTRMSDKGHLKDLEEISGSSAGAIIGLMYCLTRGDMKKILDTSLKIPVNHLMRPNLKTLLTKYGLIPLGKIRKTFSDVCVTEASKDDITFKELFDFFNVKLHVSAYCVQLEKIRYFSVDTSPDMSVLDAVCASIAIPFLFSSIKLNDGMNYIDGGSIETAPGGPFVGKDDVLILKMSYDNWMIDVKDIKSYALNLLYATMKLRYTYSFPTFNIICEGDVFDFGASSESKLRMFTAGYAQEFSL